MAKDSVNEILTNAFKDMISEKLENVTTQEEADGIIDNIDDTKLSRTFFDMYKMLANDAGGFFEQTMHSEVEKFRDEEKEYISQLNEQWKDGFVASEAMYILVREAVEVYVPYVNDLDQDEIRKSHYTFTAIMNLHGRALQVYLEVITLMKNGFADGAYARWRSMYELVIISSFILKFGEKVAKEFIESSKNKNGWYNWAKASGIFSNKKGKISFNDIKNNCDINTTVWNEQYTLSNKVIHASSQGTFGRLGTGGGTNAILIGRSNYGLTTSAEHSAISLAHISAMFLMIHPSGDSIVAVQYINNWIDTIREIYFKIHDEWFPEDERLWDEEMIKLKEERIKQKEDLLKE